MTHPYYFLLIGILVVFLMIGLGKILDHLSTQRRRLDLLHDRLIEVDALIHAHIRLLHPGEHLPVAESWEDNRIDFGDITEFEVRGDGVRCVVVRNGVRDDTEAIQSALNRAHQNRNTNLQRVALEALEQARVKSKPKSKPTITHLPDEPPHRKLDDRTNLIADTEPDLSIADMLNLE